MVRLESVDGQAHKQIQGMVDASALKRMGTPDEIAGLVEFLVGPGAAFITGSDILIDGRAFCSRAWGGEGAESCRQMSHASYLLLGNDLNWRAIACAYVACILPSLKVQTGLFSLSYSVSQIALCLG